MFDVYWTDHNRELVGERATRKEREEREGKSRERSSQKKQENARHSVSTNGSASSERSFGLFSSRKKFTTLGRLDLTSTSSEPATDATKERGISSYGVKRLLSHQESPGATVKPMNAEDLPVQQPEPIDGNSSLSSRGTPRMAPLPFDDSDSALLLTRLQTPPPVEHRGNNMQFLSGIRSSNQLYGTEMLKPGNPDTWKPPHEWNCSSSPEISTPALDEKTKGLRIRGEQGHYMSPGLTTLQREVRMMAAASPELMLANMRSEMGDASDARVYKEIEMTKKRWLFSALHQHEGYADFRHESFHVTAPSSPRAVRLLAVYETQASATFLAALHPNVKISHLSPSPISPDLFPNVQPILVPTISASAASHPLPPQLFSAVTCLSMPTLFASTEIPRFLRQVNRCLTPGGALYLTIIDPEPESTSMGPKLRQWMIDKLTINLERMCRTTVPSRTLPAWLAVRRLRGKGSTISTRSVPAVPEGLTKIQGVKDQSSIEVELRCLVMRMLWQEVWGSFVHAKTWWWEEQDIVDECIELGTYWKYSHVVAVKESS
ncbi:hypothetical protein JX265_004121 [Neoarthrinium moseri]|uniref:Uncharacterized protein n=1 Tax=Neoarthrinium moseri TaxID=1658444 RepID=A0A9Q0ARL7_9PEZI|nr:hypothetical protein JX265_004121 [Neoarthrinium moseri]